MSFLGEGVYPSLQFPSGRGKLPLLVMNAAHGWFVGAVFTLVAPVDTVGP